MKVNFGFCAPRKVTDEKKGRHQMNRYETMPYVRCGRSGLRLSRVAFGLWHNFGTYDDAANMARLVTRAFDLGITHFDLANNYGPEPGSAEENFGRLLNSELKGHRDELIVTTKAGHPMWPGPYGDWGSRKSLIASLDQSLKRMKIDYVDIFYSHRPDPETPLEETMGALSDIVRAGKALYIGISKYSAPRPRLSRPNIQDTTRSATAMRGVRIRSGSSGRASPASAAPRRSSRRCASPRSQADSSR